jgi:pimeloyl-ACP methyl ester carboxylesterase
MKGFLSILPVLILWIFALPTPVFAAQTCISEFPGHYQASFSPIVLENYERAEYVSGLLEIHYKLTRDTGTSLSYLVIPIDDTCQGFGTIPDSSFGYPIDSFVEIPASTTEFSIRFSSPTHYDFWSDTTNTKLTCTYCSRELPEFPDYFSIVSSLFYTASFNGLNTHAYSIHEPQLQPPIHTDGLETPESCPAFQSDDFFFADDYSAARYEDGRLHYHFHLTTFTRANGASWKLNFKLFDKDCSFIRNIIVPFGFHSVSLPPYFSYFSIRFSSPTHFDLWNDVTNEKIECQFCSGDLDLGPHTSTDRIQILGDFTWVDGSHSTFSSVPFPIEEAVIKPLDPVIIIPGILGSAQKDGVWVIDPILHTYDNLIETLKANGYTEGVNLFTFPYDWKLSNELNSVHLRDKVNAVKEICDCEKVDIVAHSMGGLLARSYVQGSFYGDDVNQLIFLGTPHMGAPKAYLMWEVGENDAGILNQITQKRLALEAHIKGYESLFDYIRSFPVIGLSELLPVYDYLKDKDSDTFRSYPDAYPRNEFLEDLNNNKQKLFDTGVEVTNIIGDDLQNGSITSIEAVPSDSLPLWEHGKPDGFSFINLFLQNVPGLKRGVGDGTVPLTSSSFISATSTVLNGDHSELPTLGEGFVYEILTGKSTQSLVTDLDRLDSNILYIQLLSPVDFQIIDPDGKRIGKNFLTGQEFNEIPGAFYSGYLIEDEYITIPNPLNGEYKIETQGTDNGGEYTIVTSYISEATSTESSFMGQTVPGLVTSVEVSVDNTNPENISITPTDIVVPEINIISPLQKDYLRSEILPIMVTATDTDSGLFSINISIDGTSTTATSTDLFFFKLGTHLLNATATDFQNNQSATSTEFRVIATVDSTISDINRVFEFRWITSAKTRDILIKTLNKAVKLEKRIEEVKEKLPGKPEVIKKIERIEKRLDKILAKLFIFELKRERGKTINEQAYQLLLEDIEWVGDN